MIRKYKTGDERYIARIYHDAIFQLAVGDYSQEQLQAWANPPVNCDHWRSRCETKKPFVKELDGHVVGFIELDPDGHIDCTYVDPAYSKQGVMSEIMCAIKKEAKQRNIRRLFAEVSKTARPFFERQGFVWIRDNVVNARGVSLENFIMECYLEAEHGGPVDGA